MNSEITFEILWGNSAILTHFENKTEHFIFPVIAPSAACRTFSTVYSKPNEFYWQRYHRIHFKLRRKNEQ